MAPPIAEWPPINTGAGGITSINGDTTAAQLIVGAGGLEVTTSGGTTTVDNVNPGANTELSNLQDPTQINTSLLPDADQVWDLGTSGLSWANLYAQFARDNIGDISVYFQNRELYDGGSFKAANWNDRKLFNSSELETVNWQSQDLIDANNGGISAVDWNNRKLADGGAVSSVNWQNRQLLNSNGDVAADWEGLVLSDANNSSVDSLDWGGRTAYDSSSAASINWDSRYLKDSVGTQSLNWATPGLVKAIQAYGSAYQRVTPATGATVTISDKISNLIIRPAGTIATLTINMPVNPIDSQEIVICSSQIITAVTLNGNGNTVIGGITTLGLGGFAKYKFVSTDTSYYRIG